ncbi:MAG: hypothetical protein H6732_19565 [Alphaproteobacteria bacterium]|nr:hypothetical protein [Alphaproteobacteria bacterium]
MMPGSARGWWLALPLLAIPVVWSSWHFFLCDDAYISFRYVRNLVDGQGLVFNRGEYVEGYTNFLWVLELAAIWALLGISPVDSSWVLSELMTVGTGLVVLAMALRSPGVRERGVLAVLAVLLWATNRSVAVWATSGLETRQFTFLLTLGTWLLFLDDRRGRAAGSACFGLAALTRPEALLFGPALMAAWGLERLVRRRPLWREVVPVALPFAALVGGHLLWRFAYYGEWLPNTYYAKSVRPWWDAGWTFWGMITLEHGLWLVAPLALVGGISRAARGDASVLAPFAWMVPQVVLLARLGGDHFEWRMVDPYWPVLYLAAAEGIGACARGLASTVPLAQRALVSGTAGAVITALTLLYGVALPVAHDRIALATMGRQATHILHVKLDLETTPWLRWVPGLVLAMPKYNAWGAWLVDHFVAMRAREHQVYGEYQRERYQPYEAYGVASVLPPDAVSVEPNIGVYGWVFPGLPVIDRLGLTDAIVARTHGVRDNKGRRMAHDRFAPPGYLERRGVNNQIRFFSRTAEEGLRQAPFVLKLGEEAYLPFWSTKPQWVAESFGDLPLTVLEQGPLAKRHDAPEGLPVAELFVADRQSWKVEQWLGRFDGELDGWTPEGEAFALQPAPGTWAGQAPVDGYEGTGLVNSFHPAYLDALSGALVSPPFRARRGQALTFLVGGGGDVTRTAVVLEADGVEVGRWGGRRREHLDRVVVSLDPEVGKELVVRIVDEHDGAWGHVVADAFALVRVVPER